MSEDREMSTRIDAVVQRAQRSLSVELHARAALFVRQFYDGVAAEDLAEFSDENLYGAALTAWRFAARRGYGTSVVRVFNPLHDQHGWQSTHTVVEIINDDMPFLVDSVVADLNRMNLAINLLIHPVMRAKRDEKGQLVEMADEGDPATEESFFHIQVPRQPDGARLEEIRKSVELVLADVRAAVEDWRAMLGKLDEAIKRIDATPPPIPAEQLAEEIAFLRWIRDNNYLFLGARAYRLVVKKGKTYQQLDTKSGLGVLREPSPQSIARSETPLKRDIARFVRRKELLIITKTNTRSTVHRPVHMDYIGIRLFDEKGDVVGEQRFIGLLTSTAYNRNPSEIPLLRRKVANVFQRFSFSPTGYSGKALLNILETYPRDELFQTSEEELAQFASGILQLEKRQRLRIFVRRDNYARSIFCFVYVPRDRYDSQLRKRFDAILLKAFHGSSYQFSAQVSESMMARLQYIIRIPPDASGPYEISEIEASLIEASRNWNDDLRDALADHFGEERGGGLYHRYASSFPAAYRDAFSASQAALDVGHMESLNDERPLAMSLYGRVESAEDVMHFKIFHADASVPLSGVLPMIENMGLTVLAESPYAIERAPGRIWIHDFTLRDRRRQPVNLDKIKKSFEAAFAKVWAGDAEDDGFNELVVCAGLEWHEVVVLRAYSRFMRQAGASFSQGYIARTLAANPEVTRDLINLFRARLDPDKRTDVKTRENEIRQRIYYGFDKVENLDDDRILRRFLDLIQNTLRTNYFQTMRNGSPKPYLSLKLDSEKIADLPEPRPMVEIFVYAAGVEGVHLRGGRVARGGLRWSDRREDFRTEILGLVKAQMVKNAVIVPVGAKGGFVVKRPPAEGGREAFLQEGISSYRTFICGLLDITDNLDAGGVVPPHRTVRHDGDDPYLVVAADKGTTSFSDIANGIAMEYGFWLGDAFASGGSSGYDHKRMGITAKGAWESVKHHFRELGIDTQRTDFTVIGIGDMSGDVFGNGMLLSQHIQLIGAFNHQHVFVDPEPDAKASFAERERLFAMGRSTWADYDRKLISKGGGIFERKAKSVTISPEMKPLLGIKANKLTPNELIKALLLADYDLLWNGGIGTYVKAADETHADVGDRANVPTRVDGRALRCRVVGEGGNLGFTQRGRIEYALNGGRICTDAIDNSAGVDCSDHEVNIKILLDGEVTEGDMTVKQRNTLLAKMTGEVGDLVLRDNYQQTLALSVAQGTGSTATEAQAAMIRRLEKAGILNRGIEFLPDDDVLAEREKDGTGLTRPELAVLLAYCKLDLYPALLASDLTDDPYVVGEIERYFPGPLRKRFKKRIREHRLRHEIAATVLTNSLVNRARLTLVDQIVRETGTAPADIARAYLATRDVFDLRQLWSEIESLDNKVTAVAQTNMLLEITHLIENSTLWFLQHSYHPIDIGATVALFAPGVDELAKSYQELLAARRRKSLAKSASVYMEQGVPEALARRVVGLEILAAACDIVQAAKANGLTVEFAGRIYFEIGDKLGIDWLRESGSRLGSKNHWQRQAMRALRDELFAHQRALTGVVIAESKACGSADDAVKSWIVTNRTEVDRTSQLFADMRKAGEIDLAMLTVASHKIRLLAQG